MREYTPNNLEEKKYEAMMIQTKSSTLRNEDLIR